MYVPAGRTVLSATAIVFVAGSLSAQDVCPTDWQLVEALRVGSIDGPEALVRVTDLAVGPEGDIYVTQAHVGEVTVFSPEGRVVRTIGRSGEGPGEFSAVPQQLLWSGDTLWVGDQFRVQSFTPHGRVSQFVEWISPFPAEAARYTPGLPLANGSFLGKRWQSPRPNGPTYGQDVTELAVRTFSEAGSVRDTIAVIDMRGRFVRVNDRPSLREHPLWDHLPGSFYARPERQLTSDRSAMVLPGRVGEKPGEAFFEIHVVEVDGDTASTWAVPYEPMPLEEAYGGWLRDQFSALMSGELTQGRAGYATYSRQRQNRLRETVSENFRVPLYHPPYRQILVGEDDTVWILRERLGPSDPDRWEVYDLGGRLLGHITVREGRSDIVPWSPRMNILWPTREEVWASTIDGLEVTYLHRFEVRDSCVEGSA